MKITWGYDIKDLHFSIFAENMCHYADEIEIDGELQPHGEGEAEIATWDLIVTTCGTNNPDDSYPRFLQAKTVKFSAKTGAKKPALGVMPCYIAAEKRISDLTDAIKRQIKAEKPNYDLIKRWADEIGNQCDLIEYDRCWDDE